MQKYFFEQIHFLKFLFHDKQYFVVYLKYHHNQINFFVVDMLVLLHVLEQNLNFLLKI
jgi:hypothetical protein